MAKRKKRTTKKKKTSKFLKYFIWFLIILAVLIGVGVVAYYLGYTSAKATKKHHAKLEKKHKTKTKQHIKHAKKTQRQQLQEILKKELKKKPNKEIKTYNSASHEIDNTDAKEIIIPPKTHTHTNAKPKLAIIIDDVCVKNQIQAIKALHIPITMSFLPPSSVHPNSAKLASNEKFYMVHLPMEAMHWSKEEPFTLHVDDSLQTIENRIKKIKQLYPKVHYINNHTGSKFTANESAVNKLIYVLKKYHIHFIDSRTTAQTKVPKVMQQYGFKYVARNVFLDHHPQKEAIRQQLKEAVQLAKTHGSAIAIGHPHVNTLEVLKESKYLFKDVDLVLVNQL